MPTDPTVLKSPRAGDSKGGGDAQSGSIASKDVVAMLRMQGMLGSMRNDLRAWRNELLLGMNRLFPAAVSAAFIMKDVRAGGVPTVVSIFEAGFQVEGQRNAFMQEFNVAPFQDPLSVKAVERFVSQELDTYTCLRGDVIDDDGWNNNLHVLTHRKGSGLGDCICSLHRGAERSTAYMVCAFRRIASKPAEGSVPSGKVVAADRFGERERVLLDTLHRGLDWLYTAEESAHKLNRASGLAPRLKQTLEFLLAGETERQIAGKMKISVHTVHDYVKSLYVHFGVSSRNELMTKWVQMGGQLNTREAK